MECQRHCLRIFRPTERIIRIIIISVSKKRYFIACVETIWIVKNKRPPTGWFPYDRYKRGDRYDR